MTTMASHQFTRLLRLPSQDVIHRLLVEPNVNSGGDSSSNKLSNMSPAEMIMWYCLVALILVPFAMCALYFIYHNHRSHQRALQAANEELDDDDDVDIEAARGMERHPGAQNLESMEQNIEAFSKLEKQRITRIVRSSVRRHVKVSNASRRKSLFSIAQFGCAHAFFSVHSTIHSNFHPKS